MMREKMPTPYLRSLLKYQDQSFLKDLTGVFYTVCGITPVPYNTVHFEISLDEMRQ
jgi:hypothetical protein